MKNRKIKNYLKIGILLFGINLLLWNCEKEDLNDLTVDDSIIETVSEKESISFLNENNFQAKGTKSNLTYDISKIKFENINNSESKLVVIPAKISGSNFNSRILLLKIEDTIKSVVYNMHYNPIQETAYFSGEVTLSDLNGNPIKAFKYLNGIITNYYISNDNIQSSKRVNDENEACRSICKHKISEKFCNCNFQGLQEFVIEATNNNNNNNTYVPIAVLYGLDEGGGRNDTCEANCNGWDDGGGSGSHDNNPDKKDPCDKINDLEKDSAFKEKLKELQANTSKNYETGFLLNHNGKVYDPISGNAGQDYIDFDITGSFDGFIHSHFLPNGNSIFSPDDLATLYFFFDNGFVNNTDTFVMTVVTGQKTSYTIVISDSIAFENFGANNLTGSNFTSFSNYYYDNYLHNSGPLVGLNEIAARELAMLTAIENSGLSLLRGNSEYDKWQKIEAQNNNTKNVDCN